MALHRATSPPAPPTRAAPPAPPAGYGEPYVTVTFYPLSATPQRVTGGLNVVDAFGASLLPGLGDLSNGNAPDGSSAPYSYFTGLNPTVNDAWFQQGSYTAAPQNCSFVRFQGDGTLKYSVDPLLASEVANGELCGWALTPRQAVLHSKIAPNQGDFSQTPEQHWEATQGTWRTSTALSGTGTCITNVACDTDHYAGARTVGTIPANRGAWYKFKATAGNPAGPLPSLLLSLADGTWGLLFEQDKPACLMKYVDGEPVRYKTLSTPVMDFDGKPILCELFRLGGCLCGSVAGIGFWVQETKPGLGDSPPKRIETTWPAGRAIIRAANCRATVAFGTIKWSDPDGVPYRENVSRRIPANVPPLGPTTTLTAYLSGWLNRSGVSVLPTVAPDVTPAMSGATDATGALLCNYQLQASVDGIDTPLLTKSLIQTDAVWQESTPTGLNVADCATSLRLSLAMPPIQPGALGSIVLDRTELDRRFDGVGDRKNWRDYVKTYRVVEIKTQWKDDKGDMVGNPTTLFRGYAGGMVLTNNAYAEKGLTVQLLDPIWRLQDNNARITHRNPPLDVFFARYGLDFAAAGDYDSAKFWGWDGVREIIRMFLRSEADRLRHFFPNSHYPLLSQDNDYAGYLPVMESLSGNKGGAITTGGLLFPAPFNSDAASWINSLAKQDHAIFYFGWTPTDDRETEWPRPIYGRMLEIIKNRPTYDVYDSLYTGRTSDDWIFNAQLETRPAQDITELICTSNPPGTQSTGLLPAFRIGQARLPASDPNSAANTGWERIAVEEIPLGWLTGGVEYVPQSVINALSNLTRVWPTITFKGDGRVNWGDSIRIHSRDGSMAIDGETYRVERIEHEWSGGGLRGDWRTTAYMRPKTAGGV